MSHSKVLNLGCGNKLIEYADNVDLIKPFVDYSDKCNFIQADIVEFLESVSPGTYDIIFMTYVLEHFTLEEVGELSFLLNKALKIGGIFKGITECFDSMCKIYMSKEEPLDRLTTILSLMYNLFNIEGGDLATQGPSYHKSIWTEELLVNVFGTDGFELVKSLENVGSRKCGIYFELKKITESEFPLTEYDYNDLVNLSNKEDE